MVGKDQQTVVFQHTPALGEDTAQLLGKLFGFGILDFARMARGRGIGYETTRIQALPRMKEVGEF